MDDHPSFRDEVENSLKHTHKSLWHKSMACYGFDPWVFEGRTSRSFILELDRLFLRKQKDLKFPKCSFVSNTICCLYEREILKYAVQDVSDLQPSNEQDQHFITIKGPQCENCLCFFQSKFRFLSNLWINTKLYYNAVHIYNIVIGTGCNSVCQLVLRE